MDNIPLTYIYIKAFKHATESRDKVLLALETVGGQRECRETVAQGYYGNPISVIELVLKSREEVEAFWERIRDAGLREAIVASLEERVSEKGELFLRFDKQEAVKGRLALSSGDDVVTVRVRVTPVSRGKPVHRSRAAALNELRRSLGEPESQSSAGLGDA